VAKQTEITKALVVDNKRLEKQKEKMALMYSGLQSTIAKQETTIRDLRRQLKEVRDRIKPTREALNAMTAERGKWLKRLKRAENKE